MKIEALCAAPPEALTHSPSQMPLSCPVAPQAARRPLRLRPRGHAPRNTSLRRRTNYLEPQRLRPLRHAPNTSPGCRSCASAPSPAAPAGVREEHYSRNARSARNLGARNRDAAIVRCRCDDVLGLPWCCSAHACQPMVDSRWDLCCRTYGEQRTRAHVVAIATICVAVVTMRFFPGAAALARAY